MSGSLLLMLLLSQQKAKPDLQRHWRQVVTREANPQTAAIGR